jgi:hypothetical protein
MEGRNKNNTNNSNASTSNWDFSFYKIASTPLPDPYGGFNTNIVESAEARSKRKDISLVKANKAQELAYGQFKNIFMTLLSLYFIGGNIGLFQIFIIGLYAYNNLTSILGVNNVFKPFENHEYSIIQYKLIYVFIQSISFVFIMYRIYGMGLIPLNPADWIAFIDTKVPQSVLVSHS